MTWNHAKVSNVPREGQRGLLRTETIPKTVTTVLAFFLGNHRLIEAVERGFAIGLGTLMPTMMVNLRVQCFRFLVVHDGAHSTLLVSKG